MTDPDRAENGAERETAEADPREAEREKTLRDQAERIRSGRARQGRIVLHTPLRRALFLGGLVGLILLALLLLAFA